jgi:hypothetical protein
MFLLNFLMELVALFENLYHTFSLTIKENLKGSNLHFYNAFVLEVAV